MVHTLVLGEAVDKLSQLPDDFAELLVTDIPYGGKIHAQGGLRPNNDKHYANDASSLDIVAMIREAVRVCSGSFYIFCGPLQLSTIAYEFIHTHRLTTRHGVWHKTNPAPTNGRYAWLSAIENVMWAKKPGAVFNERCAHNVWRNPCGSAKLVPTQKPLALIERMILASSRPGDTVVDCCAGSGTTILAAHNTGRIGYGIELKRAAWRIACDRLRSRAVPFVSLSCRGK